VVITHRLVFLKNVRKFRELDLFSIAFNKVEAASTEQHPTKTTPVSLQVNLF
jgi:hypothetical protein